MTEDGEESTVDTDRGLDDIGRIVFVQLAVEILQFFPTELTMSGEVEIGATVYAFQLFKAEGEFKLYVAIASFSSY